MTNVQTDAEAPQIAPTEDVLPDSDGIPLDNERQAVQISLLSQPAKRHFADRADVYVGASMFVYFSPDQVMTQDFRGPDLFVVTGTTKHERKSWVIWQEGKGPDLVIEILSDSAQRIDRTLKKAIYATRLRVPEYFWYDPFTGERAGFILHGGEYLPLEPDDHDGLPSHQVGLTLVRWHGTVEDIEATWLRWATPDGVLIPTAEEAEQSQRQRAEAERQRAESERQRAERAEQSVAELEARLARYEQRFGAEPDNATQ
jgi:Uma2 family endonuclease